MEGIFCPYLFVEPSISIHDRVEFIWWIFFKRVFTSKLWVISYGVNSYQFYFEPIEMHLYMNQSFQESKRCVVRSGVCEVWQVWLPHNSIVGSALLVLGFNAHDVCVVIWMGRWEARVVMCICRRENFDLAYIVMPENRCLHDTVT